MADPASKHRDLYGELLRLRKGRGFVSSRVEGEDLVRELLMQASTDSFDRMRFRFMSAIYTLDSKDANLLLDIYGLSEEVREMHTLAERRKIYGARIQRSSDTVASLEQAAIHRLMGKLLRGGYPQSPHTIDVPDMHNGLICETVAAHFIIENGLWRETFERWRFVATFDEADHLNIIRSYPATVRTAKDGAFRVRSELLESRGEEVITEDRFWHYGRTSEPVPMRRGEPFDLAFRIEPDDHPQNSRPLRNATRAYHHRSLHTTLSLSFVGEVPRDVWYVQELSHFALARTPGTRAEPVSPGEYVLTLRDTHGGLYNGFGWQWPD